MFLVLLIQKPLITSSDEINIFVQLVTQMDTQTSHKINLAQFDAVCTQYNLSIGCHKDNCSLIGLYLQPISTQYRYLVLPGDRGA